MNKVAVLIAAGSGMGADAAKALAKDGFKIKDRIYTVLEGVNHT